MVADCICLHRRIGFGGAGGWALGAFLGPYIHELISSLPVALAAPSTFAAVEAGFAEFGLILVFLGAFSPLPYKVMAVSAGIGGVWFVAVFVDVIYWPWITIWRRCCYCPASWRRKKADQPCFTSCGIVCGGHMADKINQFLLRNHACIGDFALQGYFSQPLCRSVMVSICWRAEPL